jgi:hypothetical protein
VKYAVIALALAAASLSSTSNAAFILQDSRVIGTEDGAMGKHQPYEAPAEGSFRNQGASTKSIQERYKNAELVVDLAYSAVSQRGTGVEAFFDGFGDDLPLPTAMSMIMPNGWQFYRDKSLDEKLVPGAVSFPGGKPWPQVLKQIGDRYALHFHIDWNDRTVLMSKGRPGIGIATTKVKVIHEPVAAAAPAGLASAGISTAVALPAAAATPAIVTSGGVSPTAGSAGAVKAVPSVPGPGGMPKVAIPVATGSAPVVIASATPPAGTVTTYVPAPKVVTPPAPVVPVIPSWAVTPKDRTIREALKSWANVAGWTFEPEHWHVPVDIPLTAGASFKGDFKSAVRQLIATTELTETPLQPCFYTNRVVRVVPTNEMCNPDAR